MTTHRTPYQAVRERRPVPVAPAPVDPFPVVHTEMLLPYALPWAKEHRPDAYGLTLKAAGHPGKFRASVVRLIELRWEFDAVFRRTAPVWALDCTKLRVTMRHRATGRTIDVCGAKAEGPHTMRFIELWDMTTAGLESRLQLLAEFTDLEIARATV